MKIGTIAAIYSIVIGVMMLGMWASDLATGNVPELKTEAYEICFHIAAEVATALALIAGGYALLARKKWGLQAYMLSMGMLLYTLVVSAGYFAQRGNVVMVGMFAVFFIAAITFIALGVMGKREYAPE